MKQLRALPLVMLSIFASVSMIPFSFADDLLGPELVSVASDDIFAPPGFDDNDNAQLVVHGQLINTCFKAAAPQVTVDKEKKLIVVQPQAYFYSGCWCLSMMVPFTQAIDLGVLPAGKYRVVEYDKKGGVRQESAITIAQQKTSAPDDLLYAAVKSARVELVGSTSTLILNGTLNDDCLEIQDTRVLHRTEHVIEVLPVTAYKQGTTCQSKPRPFELKVALPEMEPGNSLIHIRSLNGQAINTVELL